MKPCAAADSFAALLPPAHLAKAPCPAPARALAPGREAEIARRLEQADSKIADYRQRAHAAMREASLMDRVLLTPGEIRAKAKAG